MKTIKRTLAALLAMMLFISLSAQAEQAKPILVTAYRQVGWDDNVQIGYIDADGGMWYIEGSDHDLEWPWNTADQLTWLQTIRNAKFLGTLQHDDMFVLNSLVECVTAQEAKLVSAANDAGTETSYAVRYTGEEAETVLLGVSGDSMYENTDAGAQALYLYLRHSFPDVTSYFGHKGMGPEGFQPISLMAFCGYDGLNISKAQVIRHDIECEASTEPFVLDTDEAEAIRSKILRAQVVGKQSCIVTTGGSVIYTFMDENENTLAAFEFFNGHLVMRDGMYDIAD